MEADAKRQSQSLSGDSLDGHDLLAAQLNERRQNARLGGGAKRIEVQHSKGKMTARERVEVLLDDGSFVEVHALAEHVVGEQEGVGEGSRVADNAQETREV